MPTLTPILVWLTSTSSAWSTPTSGEAGEERGADAVAHRRR